MTDKIICFSCGKKTSSAWGQCSWCRTPIQGGILPDDICDVPQGDSNESQESKDAEKTTDCASCPAAASWDYDGYKGKGLICFYAAYFRGRAGKPAPCSICECPKKDTSIIN